MEAKFPRQLVRVVKETDSKSVGQCPRKFESCSCRFLFKQWVFVFLLGFGVSGLHIHWNEE